MKEPKTLYNGRKPGNFGLLPREIWANWLLCAIGNAQTENVDWTFSDDEDGGGDGILFDRASDRLWKIKRSRLIVDLVIN